MRRAFVLLLLAIVVAVRADEELDALWRDACLWEVGANVERVPAARRKLIAEGAKALDYVVPAKLDTQDGLVIRAIQTVVTGIAGPEAPEARQAAIARLTLCLESDQGNVRRNAAEILGMLAAVEAAPALAKLLTDPDARLGAMRALGTLKAGSAVPAIAAVLGSDAPERLRVEAAAALGAIGGDPAGRALVDALGVRAAAVRFAAQFALERLQAADLLRSRLADPDRRTRLHAIAALGKIGGAAARGDLLPLLDDPDAVVRGFAVEALTPVLEASDRDDIRRRLADESHPFAQGKLQAALERIDRLILGR